MLARSNLAFDCFREKSLVTKIHKKETNSKYYWFISHKQQKLILAMQLKRSFKHKTAPLFALFTLLLLNTIVNAAGPQFLTCGIVGNTMIAQCGVAKNTTILTLRVEIGNATAQEYCKYNWQVEWGDGTTFGIPYYGESLEADPGCQLTDPTFCPATIVQRHTYGEAGTYEIRNLIHVTPPSVSSNSTTDIDFGVPDSSPVAHVLEITEDSCTSIDPFSNTDSRAAFGTPHLGWFTLVISTVLVLVGRMV